MEPTLLAKLDRIPPCICRLMAKGSDGRLMSNKELMQRTGWCKSRVRRVCAATSFKNFTVGDVDKLLQAYGLSWSTQRRLIWLMKRAWSNGGLQTMKHLRYKTGWQASMIRGHQKRIAKTLSKKP